MTDFKDASSCPTRPEEQERLEALRSYQILDTHAEEQFDHLVELAASICGKPYALISLVDDSRLWFKAAHGTALRETEREVSFCSQVILDKKTMVVKDAALDERFRNSSLVTGPTGIRFYAGAPLINYEGYALGTLCVLDFTPGDVSPDELRALEILAQQVMVLFEFRRTSRRLAIALEEVRELSDLMTVCSYCRRVRADDDRWHSLEFVLHERTGINFSHGICADCLPKVLDEFK